MLGGQKILYNTLILYLRMFVSIALGLFSTRILLGALGVTDYGIFNLVAGVIGMLSFLNSSMSASTQRYISHTLGSGNNEKLKKVFATSITTHVLIAFLVVILLELAGLPFMKKSLTIPQERFTTAIFVFHFMAISTFFSIITVPFDGVLNAHENFSLIALFQIFLSFGNLATAIFLIYTGFDKLITYAVLTTCFFVIQLAAKQIYCQIYYAECNYNFKKYADRSVFSEMLAFAGWNMFGALCNVARNQGIAVVLNIFFGVVVNAAYGIANQVNGQLYSLSTVIGKAISPQLTKSEGEGNRTRMLQLGMLASKIPFMLMSLASIPIIIEMPYILNLWLKNVPENTVIFTRLILVLTLLMTLSSGIGSIINAIGKIKTYQFVIGSTLLLNIPISWLFFKFGVQAYYAIVVSIILEFISHLLRLVFLRKLTGTSIKIFLFEVDLKSITIVVLSLFLTYFSTKFIVIDIVRLCLVFLISTTLMCTGWYKYALLENEKKRIHAMVLHFRKKDLQ